MRMTGLSADGAQRDAVNGPNAAVRQQSLSPGDQRRIPGIRRGVGVAAQNHGAALLPHDPPEGRIRVVLALAEAQKIELQRDRQLHRLATDGPDVAVIGLGISGEVEQIRVGEVGEQAGFQGLQGLAAVLVQQLFVVCGPGAVDALRFVVE